MSKFYIGSIDLSKINKSDIVTTDKDGVVFKNGAKYLNLAIWVNDEPDKYGNSLSIKAGGGKDKKGYYIGNAKEWKQANQAVAVVQSNDDEDDLPW